MSVVELRGVGWTEERGTSDEGSSRLERGEGYAGGTA
jgi:hypothetical protein